jgi:chromate transporter
MPLTELALLFLKLGTIAFGGPAAHTAMMRDEVVTRRGWLTDREFLDLVAATNLIPGPNSTELAIHIGHRRAGWPGLLVAGAAFILPATLIVGAIAWAYVEYGARPDVRSLFSAIAPVIIAIIIHALWGMGKTALTSGWLVAVALVCAIAVAFGTHELAVLGCAALAGLIRAAVQRPKAGNGAFAGLFATGLLLKPSKVIALLASLEPLFIPVVTLPALFWTFLKTGAVLFGSGYVLVAFLRADLVERLHWLSEEQLLDAIAIGQFTPGPVFTSATFVGYLVAGMPGAALATIGIFLPAFFYVAITAPFIPRLRASRLMGAILDAVTAASLGLMAIVTLQLFGETVFAGSGLWIAAVSLIALFTTKVNSAWLILAAAAVGLLQAWM